MDDERFWGLIDDALRRENEPDGRRGVAKGTLSAVLVERLKPGQIVLFSRRADLVADRAGTWDLLAACHLIDGWHSDDAFRDFRDFLILAGRGVFERAVIDADSLAEQPLLVKARRDGRASPGPIDELARAAWARLTGNNDEDDWFDAVSSVGIEAADSQGEWPRGAPWSAWARGEYEARLPRLLSLVGFR